MEAHVTDQTQYVNVNQDIAASAAIVSMLQFYFCACHKYAFDRKITTAAGSAYSFDKTGKNMFHEFRSIVIVYNTKKNYI
jgi:hypothetical protein